MEGGFVVGELVMKTHIRFGNFYDFESCIDAIDVDCDSEDSIFNGVIYKQNTPQFNMVQRS